MNALRARLGLDAVVGLMLLAGFVILAAGQGGAAANVRVFQLAYLMGFAGYLLIVRLVLRDAASPGKAAVRWPVWLAACLVLRAGLLVTTPSDDPYRYVWEGRIQLDGFNPYGFAPDDPALMPLRDDDWSRISHPSFPAIYPPLAQMVFAAVAAVMPTIGAMKLVFAVLDGLVVCVLAAALRRSGQVPERALIYALCPLTLVAFAMEGHVDSLMLLPLAGGAWALAARRERLAGVMFGLAISAKLIAAVMLWWLARRHPKACFIAVGVAALTFLPYIGAGAAIGESLLRFGSGPTFMSFLGTLGFPGYDLPIVRGVIIVVFLSICGGLAAWRRELAMYAVAATGLLLVLMPVVHAWYFTWILVWMPFAVRARWIAVAGAMVVYYEAVLAQQATGEWALPLWAPFIVWGVWVVVWVIETLRKPRPARREELRL